jgi:hypothetical protein
MTVFGRAVSILLNDQKSFFGFPLKVAKNDGWTFRKIDAARPKYVMERSETSHFVGNWLFYHFTLLKQNLFASSECWKSRGLVF